MIGDYLQGMHGPSTATGKAASSIADLFTDDQDTLDNVGLAADFAQKAAGEALDTYSEMQQAAERAKAKAAAAGGGQANTGFGGSGDQNVWLWIGGAVLILMLLKK